MRTPPLNKRTSGLTVILYCSVGKSFAPSQQSCWRVKTFLNMSHLFLCTYTKLFQQAVSGSGGEARSQGCGGDKQRSQVLCSFFLLLLRFLFSTLVLRYHIIIRKVPPVSSQRQQTSEIPSARRASGFSAARVRCGRELLFSFTTFYLNLRIYLHKTIGSDEPSWAEPTVSIPLELRRIFYFFFCVLW